MLGASWLKRRNLYYIRRKIETRLISSGEGYASVIQLRNEIYGEAGKVTDSYPLLREPARDSCRVLAFFHGHKLVGSVVIHIPNGQEPMDCVEGPLLRYPTDLPPKSESIELSRLCFRKEYRGTDLIKEVYRQGILALAQTGRSYILLAADDKLKRKYSHIRFKDTGYRYSNRAGKSGELSLMVSRLKHGRIYGLSSKPLLWNLFLFDPIKDLMRARIIPARHWFFYFPYVILRPVAWIFEQFYLMQLKRVA